MITLYGIKNCDSVKKAKNFLEKQSIAYRYHDFREDGLSESTIIDWLNQCGIEQLVNKKSTTWKNLSESEKSTLTADTVISLCMKYETLIKRPVLEHNGTAYIGFNEKLYLSILTE